MMQNMGTNHRVEAADDDMKGDGSSEHMTGFEVKPLSRRGSSSASSSSSDSSQDLVNNNVHGNDDNGDNQNQPLEKSELIKSPTTPFRVSFVNSSELSPDNHMPARQVPGGYVPNRIPSSIFSSKPATPMDWSTASNESLFSIHVGNGSFSKDQFFMLYKSGELTKLDEQIIAQGNNVLPPLQELDDMAMAETRNENIEKGAEATQMSTMVAGTSEVAEVHSNKMVPPAEEVHHPVSKIPTVDVAAVAGGHNQEMKLPVEVQNSPTCSISGLSDESNNSTLSFAFPVLNGNDAGRFSSANGDQNNKGLQTKSAKQQQQQQQKQSTEELKPQTPVTPQNATSRSWFSWFYCCRFS